MTTTGGREHVKYLVKCALAASDSIVKQTRTAINYTFAGGIGLCPEWKNGGIPATPGASRGFRPA